MTTITNVGNLGRNLHRLLYRKKMTKTELGEKVGVSQSMISYIVLGRKRPSAETLEKIANVLDTTVDELVKGKEEPG